MGQLNSLKVELQRLVCSISRLNSDWINKKKRYRLIKEDFVFVNETGINWSCSCSTFENASVASKINRL